MQRDKLTELEIEDAIRAVTTKLRKKLLRHGLDALVSTHESFGLLQEEVNEVATEMQKNDIVKFSDEMEDIAVVAIWSIASLNKYLT